jgi:ATP-dependent Zn protease
MIFSIVVLANHAYLSRTLESFYFGEIFMPPKVKSDDQDFQASARTVLSSESERRMYALYEEPPHIPIKIPFIKTEVLDRYAFSFLLLRFHLRQGIQFLTQNIYFIAAYGLSCLVAYNHIRFYYKDQLFSYGLRRELPGIAEQVQSQSVSTFNFATMPLALEKADMMGGARSSPPNKLARFAVTPFVQRVDIYRDAALIQFNRRWVDLLGNNLIRQWYLKPTNTTVGDLIPRIPQIQTLSSLPKEEFQPALVTHDYWRNRRPFMELADEMPTQLEDLFSEPIRGLTKRPPGPLELLRAFDLPTSSRSTLPKTGFQPVKGGALQEWLRFFSTKTASPYELLHVLPLVDLSPQDQDRKVTTLSRNGRKDLLSRIAWQGLVDMTARVQEDRLLFGPRPELLASPPHLEDIKSRQRRYLSKEHILDLNPIFFKWLAYRPKGRRSYRVRLTGERRKARIARKFKMRKAEIRQSNRLVTKAYDKWLGVEEGAFQKYNKVSAQEHAKSAPFWEFYGQGTFKKTQFNSKNRLFQLTSQEVDQILAGPPRLNTPRPPRNPEDFLPVSPGFQLQLPTFKKPVVSALPLQALKDFFQRQTQAAGQGMKEFMVTLGPRLVRGGPTRRVMGASARQAVADASRTEGIENNLLRRVEVGVNKKSTRLGVSRSRALARLRATWSGSPHGQYLKALYAYRQGLKRYNKNYNAPRTLYTHQVEHYKQLLRQAREIRSLWKTTLPMFLAQEMQGSFVTPQPFIHSSLGQMTPATWDHASRLAERLRKQAPPASLESIRKRQPNTREGARSVKFLMRMLLAQKTSSTPEFKTLYAALPLEQRGKASPQSGQFSDPRVQQKLFDWRNDFYALLRKYDLSQGSIDTSGVSGGRSPHARTGPGLPVRRSFITTPRSPFALINIVIDDDTANYLTRCAKKWLFKNEWKKGKLNYENLLPRLPVEDTSAKAQNRVDDFRLRESPNSLDPLDLWLDGYFTDSHTFDKPIGFPAGSEYHWARRMQAYAQARYRQSWRMNKVQGLVTLSGQQITLSPKFVADIWRKVNDETTEYLGKVHGLQVSPKDRKQFKDALEYAQLVSDLGICRQVRKEIPTLLESTLGLGHIREYTQALSKYIPETRPAMHGFLFPDKTYEEGQKELRAAQQRYALLNMSPWGVFKTVVARRPFEVFLPPGWRPFNEMIFSSEEASRSVIASSSPHVLPDDPTMVPVSARPSARLADTKKRNPLQSLRAFPRLMNLQSSSDLMRDVWYKPLGSSDVGEHSRAHEVPSMQEWGTKYLLGRGNIFKDRLLSFRGQQNRFHAQPTATAPDQIQWIRAQMGLRASHRSPLYGTSPQIRHAQKKRIPLKRQGYLRHFFRARRESTIQTTDQQLLGKKTTLLTVRPDRLLRRDLYPLDKQSRLEERRYVSRDKRESWRNWLTAPLSSGRSMLQPRVNAWTHQVKGRKSMQQLREAEWAQLLEKAAASRADSSFRVKMPWEAFKARPVNSLSIQNTLWKLNAQSPSRLYLVSPKDRLATLTQIMMQLTRVTPGMYNEVEYSNIVTTFNYFDQQERFGLRSPFVSHLVMPRHELLPEPTGAPTLLLSSMSEVFTFAQPRWTQAEQLIQQQLLDQRFWQERMKAVVDLVEKVPVVRAGKSLLRPLYSRWNYEPITHYWWCYLGQIVFLIWAFRAYRYALKETWNELVDILFDNFPLQLLREAMNELGLYDPFTYRIILESPDNFSSSAGSLNKRLFYQTCEVILGLRNLRKGGRSRKYLPKGILFTGVPGTGKTYLVQMLAGAAGMPVITQTASELFDQSTVAMLGLEDSTLTPADQLAFAFDRARELAPCIFFVDEIDALGVTRASLLTSTGELANPEDDLTGYVRGVSPGFMDPFTPHMSDGAMSDRTLLAKNSIEDLRQDDYKALTHGHYPGSNRLRTGFLFWHQDKARVARAMRVGTLTEFLVQLDGLRSFSGVLVIGATNRLASIDPALVRPGRLERVIQLYPLSTRQRIDVLRRQCEKVGTVPSINWRYLANRTRGATAANLATAVNHSAVRAVITGSLHRVETLEYGLDTMTRHKLARQMISVRPLPKLSASRAHDPFNFLRIAYYNAGRAIVHNILPNHLSLPYAKLAVEPFDPDWTLDELVVNQKTRQQLDSMLIGLYAGKAAEFAMLYRDNPSEEVSTLLQLSESDQGSQEMAYGTELAHAIVDGWYLLEEQRLASALPVVDNETCRNIRLSSDLETRDALDYWTDNHARLFAHLSATIDSPEVDTDTKTFTPGLTIHQRHEELAFWALSISRLYMSATSTSYSKWSKFELRQPWQSERSRFWVPPDVYYHQEPGSLDDFERFVKFVRPQEHKTRKNTVKRKQQRPEQWKKLSKQWSKGRFKEWKPEGEYYDLAGRQMSTFPAWHEMDRDYLLQGLVRRAFNAAALIFQDHMELLDRMATYLLKHQIIREDKIQEIIFEYTVDRYKAKLPLAVPLSKYFEPYGSYRIPQVNLHGAEVPPLIGPIIYVRPAGEFERSENNQYLVYQRAWPTNTPVRRVPLDVFEHTFDPYASREGGWVTHDQEQQRRANSPSSDAEGDALR